MKGAVNSSGLADLGSLLMLILPEQSSQHLNLEMELAEHAKKCL
jgi:hypothetical protein